MATDRSLSGQIRLLVGGKTLESRFEGASVLKSGAKAFLRGELFSAPHHVSRKGICELWDIDRQRMSLNRHDTVLDNVEKARRAAQDGIVRRNRATWSGSITTSSTGRNATEAQSGRALGSKARQRERSAQHSSIESSDEFGLVAQGEKMAEERRVGVIAGSNP